MKNETNLQKYTVESEMKRTMLGLILAGAALSTACVDADPSLLLTAPTLASCSVDEEAGTVGCEYGGRGDATRAADVLTVNLDGLATGQAPGGNGPNTYTMGVALSNRLIGSDDYAPIGEGQNLRVDQNVVIVESFEFTFPTDSNQPGVDSLDSEFRYSVEVDTGDGSSGAAVNLVDASNIATWKAVFGGLTGGNKSAIVPAVINVQALGRTIGGQEVESNIVSVPLSVCLGCAYPNSPYGLAE